jgi:hypothetical protein
LAPWKPFPGQPFPASCGLMTVRLGLRG